MALKPRGAAEGFLGEVFSFRFLADAVVDASLSAGGSAERLRPLGVASWAFDVVMRCS